MPLKSTSLQNPAAADAVSLDDASCSSALGGRIRAARVKAGRSQDILAKALGTSRASLISWEKDEAVPRIDILEVLRQQCDVDPDWITNGQDLTPRSNFRTVDWLRYDRIAADVQAVCSEYGVDPASTTAIELTRSIFADEPGSDRLNLRRFPSVLCALMPREVA